MNNNKFRKNSLYLGLAAALSVVGSLSNAGGSASKDAVLELNLAAQNISQAIGKLSSMSGVQVVLGKDVVGADIDVQSIHGSYKLSEALDAMLENTGLTYQFSSGDSVLITVEDSPSEGSNAEKEDDLEEVVVTGSQVITDPSMLTRQVDIFSREDLENSGISRLDEFLERLPQNVNAPNAMGAANPSGSPFGVGFNAFASSGVNLRGLGQMYTLVLIDGRRPAGGGLFGEAVDISNIHLDQVDRIEILYDGAASVYGADAVGGVVNIITNRRYEGATVRLTYAAPESGGGERLNLSLGKTFSWDGGNLTTTFTYQTQNEVEISDRPDLNFFNSVSFSAPPVAPGNIVPSRADRGDVLFYVRDNNGDGDTLDPGERLTGGVATGGTNWQGAPEYGQRSQYAPGTLAANNAGEWRAITATRFPDLEPGQVATLYDFSDDNEFSPIDPDELQGSGKSVTPEDETYGLQFNLNQEITDRLSTHWSASYSSTSKVSGRDNTFFSQFARGRAVDNPFGDNVRIVTRVPVPQEEQDINQRSYSLNGSFDYNLSDDWQLQADLSASRGRNFSHTINSPVYGDLQAKGSDWEDVGGLFYHNFNYNTEQELIDAIIAPILTSWADTEARDHTLTLSGRLADLPAGALRSVFSVGYRSSKTDSYNENTDFRSAALSGGVNVVYTWEEYSSRSSSKSARVELVAPLVSQEMGIPLVNSLLFNGSVRTEEENLSGLRDTYYSAGFTWGMHPSVTARINGTTSSRLGAAVRRSGDTELAMTGLSYYDKDTGNRLGSTVLGIIFGNDDSLEPEENEGLSVGVQYMPERISGLRFDIDYSLSNLDNRIGSPTTLLYADPSADPSVIESSPYWSYMTEAQEQYLDIIGVPAYFPYSAGVTPVRDMRLRNLGGTRLRSVNFSTSYQLSTDNWGDWNLTWRHQRSLTHKVREAENSAAAGEDLSTEWVDLLGSVNRLALSGNNRKSYFPVPEDTGALDLRWEKWGMSVGVMYNYRSTTSIQTERLLYGRPAAEWIETSVPEKALDFTLSYDFAKSDVTVPSWLANARLDLKVDNALIMRDQNYRYDYIYDNFGTMAENHRQREQFFGLNARGRVFNLTISSRL